MKLCEGKERKKFSQREREKNDGLERKGAAV